MGKKAEAKKQIILDAAIKVFAEKGYHYATVEEIAKEAGIAKGSVHAYFENKLDILLTLLLVFWQTINETNTRKLAQLQDAAAGLKAIFATFQELLLQAGPSIHWGKILQAGLPELHTYKSEELRDKQQAIAREEQKLVRTIDAVIKAGQARGRIKKSVKSAVLRQILGGSSQLLVYGLFMNSRRKTGIGYNEKDVTNAVDLLIDMFSA
jgi:TetR/AcrR family fatty acid metabolism transcriptional regulator